jgi:alpha,alpha-trehalose-phosphate synthase [UDP-forming]
METKASRRIGSKVLIVSNRLPIVISKDSKGDWHVEPGAGGLVTALAPVLKNRGGTWIGWSGITEEDNIPELDKLLKHATRDAGYDLKPVTLTMEEWEKYYKGFANEILWPLFHDFQTYCNFDPEYWAAYQEVNRKFAQEVHRNSGGRDFIWVQDYHLITFAREIRSLNNQSKLGFFLHIPFPPLDIFVKLPWRFQILRALLEYDLIGLQTQRDRRNFINCIRTLLSNVKIRGKGQVISLYFEDREIRIGTFPISIDFNEFDHLAASKQVADTAWYLHEKFPNQKIVLGVDRLDYSKGILEKLNAYRNALRRYPELRSKTVLVQILVPSRRTIPMYASLKEEIERLVGAINGEFTHSGWVPIHYMYRSLDRPDLVAYYRTAEILLVTPIKDGMNLVAKEYCASKVEDDGVLIMSEYAGTVAQFHKHALIVNPYDIEGVADAIYQAFTMPGSLRRENMSKLRHIVRKSDIYWWVNSFLLAAIAKRIDNFPVMADYIPEAEKEVVGT